jgi:imidazole glycerol-phosphate synthase subunit HisH
VIAIVDYGVNNLASVRNAFRAAGADVEVTADQGRIEQARGVVLPGIGAASAGMEQIRQRRLEEPLRRSVESGKPLLGLCLGMQLLFDRSEEGGNIPCLGIVPGTVRLLTGAPKVPQIGWNQVETRSASRLWRGLPADPYFYFVHSYVCVPSNPEVIAGETEYGERFCSALAHDAVWATQFHPERSGKTGLGLIANFVGACGP